MVKCSHKKCIKIKKSKKSTKPKKSKKSNKSKKQEVYVLVYNINYWDKDGIIIIDNPLKNNKDYKYQEGTAGSYGFYNVYTVPSKKIKDFKAYITNHYTNLGIKTIKIIIETKKNKINSKLYLLDKEISKNN